MKILSTMDITGMLESAAAHVMSSIQELNELDTQIGDGDHGTTMKRVMSSLCKTLETDTENDTKTLLDSIGWNIMSQDGGSAGMLMGMFFSGLAKGIEPDQTAEERMSAMLKHGADALLSGSGAGVGEKTMVDALVPAVSTFEETIKGGGDFLQAMRLSSIAARQGAEDSKKMLPTRGRAKNLKERALGVADPGATSIALIFEGFYHYCEHRGLYD
ncbi:dihydroxyacetone kinase subunit DhaL [Endozoicomonas montiporae]|uniref:Dihydroxyacetone kinase, C-terminal domain n=1 Tax=Endozoicomonas montiporae CL-33 TaxID=570277 RepID=A0A142BI43_9GAMM|nr:dihydroxyacetone kinase subunit DhaL [Endozoicomonas montiporae]AMO58419.1 dihydroxyacetone kinase, C-terminal domain [Endozoicomonas montiporae CL-33]